MPDGVKTRRDLVNNVLDEMGCIAAGQPASPEDVLTVDAYVDPTVARLQALDIVGDFDVEQVPDEFFTPLSILIGDSLLGKFMIPRGSEDDPTSWAFKVANAKMEMRKMGESRTTYAPVQAEYF